MIKTSRSRLEIRQEPDITATLAGLALTTFGMVEAVTTIGAALGGWAMGQRVAWAVPCARALLGFLFMGSGWLFLRGRSRVVLDRDHRMVARYLGVGGHSTGGNRTWDLEEFGAVVLVSRERRRFRFFRGMNARSYVVCLRRRDGGDLEIYWARDTEDGVRVATSAAEFVGLPCFGR